MRQLVKVIVTPSSEYKAEIERRDDGNYQATIFKWTIEIIDGSREVGRFWEPISGTVSITDTISNARKLAVDKLRGCSGESF
jgi:hypothetical protein